MAKRKQKAQPKGDMSLIKLFEQFGTDEKCRIALEKLRWPDGVKCPRNHLTSFTGTILSYSRALGHTEIRMRTDEHTTEKFVLQHPKSEDPSLWFLLRGMPFKGPDWAAIESEKGRLRPNMRATVWVCDDGSNPIVDWRPQQ